MSAPVGALVLAAGFSNRFGGIKLLAKLEDGSTVFQRTMENIERALPNTLVVTRPGLQVRLAPYCGELLVFDEAEKGMGATLGFGIRHLPYWRGVLVCLADMPFIKSDSYRRIAAAVSPASIIQPRYRGQPGNPVAFGAAFFPELIELSGDAGGRDVLNKHPVARQFLDLDDPALLRDIDTPADLDLPQDMD